MILYGYFRSSAAYRVRIALNLKGLDWQQAPINLLKAEQLGDNYKAINPQGLLPALALSDGRIIAQSGAILEWLEEQHPDTSLLPEDPFTRAQVRSVAAHIACDIHPLNNLSIMQYLKAELGADDTEVSHWYAHWVARGFSALEHMLQHSAGNYCFGDSPTLADCYLVPQMFNARRFKVPLDNYPLLTRICDYCDEQDAFIQAQPGNQPDAV